MRKNILIIGAVLLLFFLGGCSTAHYRESADREVYRIIREKEAAALGEETGFTIDETRPEQDLPDGKEPLLLSLSEALELAATRNRDYQRQKEEVYLKALALTYERYLYRPRFQQSRAEVVLEKQGDREDLRVGQEVSVVHWLADGAQLSLDFSSDFFRSLTGDPREALGSVIRLNLLQPLFGGAGRRIAQENLTQAERDVIYQIRAFVRYQRTFSVSTAAAYYGILNQKQRLANEESNYRRLQDNLNRAEMLGEAGRLPLLQVDQARQEALAARERLVAFERRYRDALDNFKLTLGLPTDRELELAEAELDRLAEELPVPALEVTEALTLAVRERLDLLNEHDRLDDARRKVAVAADNLRGRLDLFAGATARTRAGEENLFDFNLDDTAYRGGARLDFPLDRLGRRNTYRQGLINLERNIRAHSLLRDRVILDVRGSWRTLEQARQSYEIEELSLNLARQRVESVNLLLDAGRATQRDILEAQAALLRAENALVDSLIAYHVAYLNFLTDVEQLPLGTNGVWTGGFNDQQAN